MLLFADTADVKSLKPWFDLGIVDGVTTSAHSLTEEEQPPLTVIQNIREVTGYPIIIEAIQINTEEALDEESQRIAAVSSNIVVGLPITENGLKVCKTLTGNRINTNMQLCFSVAQALLAAKCGATYVSIPVGILIENGIDAVKMITDLRISFEQISEETSIIATALQNTQQIEQVAIAGAHIGSISPQLFQQMLDHPLTIQYIQQQQEALQDHAHFF